MRYSTLAVATQKQLCRCQNSDLIFCSPFQSFFENDSSHLDNEYVKFVMCMLQDTGNFKDLIVSVPTDVQALVLLHNGVSGSNYTSE